MLNVSEQLLFSKFWELLAIGELPIITILMTLLLRSLSTKEDMNKALEEIKNNSKQSTVLFLEIKPIIDIISNLSNKINDNVTEHLTPDISKLLECSEKFPILLESLNKLSEDIHTLKIATIESILDSVQTIQVDIVNIKDNINNLDVHSKTVDHTQILSLVNNIKYNVDKIFERVYSTNFKNTSEVGYD